MKISVIPDLVPMVDINYSLSVDSVQLMGNSATLPVDAGESFGLNCQRDKDYNAMILGQKSETDPVKFDRLVFAT